MLPLEIRARARESIELPAFAGSSLRGAFGHALKDVVCVVAHRECERCRLAGACSYPYLFETPRPEGARRLRGARAVPHPYAFHGLEGPQVLATGAPFEFGVTLIGSAVESAPLVIEALRRAAERGLGPNRGRFDLCEVAVRNRPNAEPLLLLGGEALQSPPERDLAVARTSAFTRDLSGGRAIVEFTAPARLTWNGGLSAEVPFHVLARNLLRRASSLLEFHEAVDLDVDFRGWIARAERVDTVAARFEVEDRLRYSTRQGRRMNLAGVLGRAVYAGELEPFAPLLGLGQLVGVGKGTTFGLGRMRVTTDAADAWTN